MNLDHYPYAPSKNFKHYYFYSEGPNGRIKKTVIYSVLWDDPLVYNLAFGDEDLKTGMISDTSKSNNQDRDKGDRSGRERPSICLQSAASRRLRTVNGRSSRSCVAE